MRLFTLIFLICFCVGAEVNLDNQFSPYTPVQAGGSCHIFTSTALFEAACFRATGARVDLSEAQLINKHLTDAMYEGSEFENFMASGQTYEGGHNELDLRRIFMGAACTEEEWPLNRDFVKDLNQINEVARLNFLRARSQFRKLETQLTPIPFFGRRHELEREHAKKLAFLKMDARGNSLELLRNQKKLHPQKTQNEALKKCLSMDFKIERKINPSLDEMKKLLDAGMPFACSGGYVAFPLEGNGIFKKSDSHIIHTAVVLGHRRNALNPKNHDFRVRDSGLGATNWGWSINECHEILTFDLRRND